MNRPLILSMLCLILAGVIDSPATASGQQSSDRTVTETAKATQKPRTTASKPVSVKTTSASPKPTASVTAQTTDKPGKRFWSRIMNCFRDVHSVEKKTSKE